MDSIPTERRARLGSVQRLALTPTEAAHSLGISTDFFREFVAPELRWVRRGRKKLVAVSELEHWLDRNAVRTLESERCL
jgi:excisionase family DNA binding protein